MFYPLKLNIFYFKGSVFNLLIYKSIKFYLSDSAGYSAGEYYLSINNYISIYLQDPVKLLVNAVYIPIYKYIYLSAGPGISVGECYLSINISINLQGTVIVSVNAIYLSIYKY